LAGLSIQVIGMPSSKGNGIKKNCSNMTSQNCRINKTRICYSCNKRTQGIVVSVADWFAHIPLRFSLNVRVQFNSSFRTRSSCAIKHSCRYVGNISFLRHHPVFRLLQVWCRFWHNISASSSFKPFLKGCICWCSAPNGVRKFTINQWQELVV